MIQEHEEENRRIYFRDSDCSLPFSRFRKTLKGDETMDEYERNIIPQIEAIYDTFTALEKTIADYSLLWTCYQRKRESMFTEREVPVWQLWK